MVLDVERKGGIPAGGDGEKFRLITVLQVSGALDAKGNTTLVAVARPIMSVESIKVLCRQK